MSLRTAGLRARIARSLAGTVFLAGAATTPALALDHTPFFWPLRGPDVPHLQAEATVRYDGAFALQSGKALTLERLVVTPGATDVEAAIDLWATAAGRTLRDYDVDMTKRLHLVLISDDFATFVHVHPQLGADGHFRMQLHVPRTALYHLYADATPHGIGRQVFRFDVPFGDGTPGRRAAVGASRTVHAGPYAVTLDSLKLHAGDLTMLTAHITKDGKPAADLHPYLGALAHAVFIQTRDLTYAHTHPMPLDALGGMNMGAMSEPAELSPGATVPAGMMLHAAVSEPGTYRLWLQFRGGASLYVAPFVLTAS